MPPEANVLNRLLALEYRSLPMYLRDASPWTQDRDHQAASALANIVADQAEMARRIATVILERRGNVEPGDWPTDFTHTHYLSLDFLLNKMVEYEKRDIAVLEAIAAELSDDPQARELAEEVLGSQRAHLEVLESLAKQPDPGGRSSR